MENKEIIYQLSECLITTTHTREKVSDRLDRIALEMVEERLKNLIQHFTPPFYTPLKPI